ncbi:MAG: gamma-glutamyltransferase [Desulfofustis sp. PB-SRB1]|jgi:gamma-glutamyltranspeptidase/glutathione hydrolase|nr:gamma-glutamyltransferase [Desulfofustis sp. PB-SRB1]MBM1001283.1 gamma-glutamyltransferase [Desulfofustis sp. PB-SRB1]HBH29187.1 gamma-glutamyltransferase [Desulfofustis sp.]
MSRYRKALVASGHTLVSEAGATILKEGGNAFDAVVAAGFAAAVAEPSLTSLGGGGLLVGYDQRRGQSLFFDFFVNTPGMGRKPQRDNLHFFPVTIQFSGSTQDFNVGLGSVAVPGNLKGLIHVHRRLGRMGLAQVIAPARELARGHTLNKQQGNFFSLLYPILTMTERGRSLYERDGRFVQAGDTIKNPDAVSFFDQLAHDHGREFYEGELARRIDTEMRAGGGLLSAEDLRAYEVYERKPLAINYRDYRLLTCPGPSVGGAMIGLSLSLLEHSGVGAQRWGDGAYLVRTLGLMREVERLRADGFSADSHLSSFLADHAAVTSSIDRIRLFSRGTTHISVADKMGNCASMTFSNGEGSGYIAPGTGVMLNNMMGEDDLHPDGFHLDPPGLRVASMMSPSLLIKDETVRLVIGSGGSKRIRTSMGQVLSQVFDYGRSLTEAVEAPRLFWDGEAVQIEPGFSDEALAELKRYAPINVWDDLDVYFGGVHAVIPGETGAGDPRRGGSVVEV